VTSGRVHRYAARCEWRGSTAAGYERYDRTHTAFAPPAEAELKLTTGDERVGNPDHLNPEQLLLAAASSCQLLWFLHVAAVARIDVHEYVDEAEAVMPDDDPPSRITEIVLRPRVVVAPGPSRARILHLLDLAHSECYIANSLRCDVRIEPEIVVEEGVGNGGGPQGTAGP
jgi:organic hydroperoxide reductase OsmC/OhrA